MLVAESRVVVSRGVHTEHQESNLSRQDLTLLKKQPGWEQLLRGWLAWVQALPNHAPPSTQRPKEGDQRGAFAS